MNTTAQVVLRIALSILIGVIFGWVVSEASYQMTKDPNRRDTARQIEIVIPEGTAARIAAGEEAAMNLSKTMTFVEGDLLIVRNQDTASHQLGPVWVPAQSSGVLELNTASTYSYACSFSKDQVLGIKVLPRLTLGMRIQGALMIGFPSAVMIALYSFLIFPLKPGTASSPAGGAA
jgi:hypothetical protein